MDPSPSLGFSSTDVREATEDDLSDLIQLDEQLFKPYGTAEDPKVIVARVKVFSAGCLVISREHATPQSGSSSVVAYVTSERWSSMREPTLDENPRDSHDDAGSILCITTLAVSPDMQGKGLGTMLLDCLLDRARVSGCTQAVLETTNAAKFYQQRGFEIVDQKTERDIPLFILCKHLTATKFA